MSIKKKLIEDIELLKSQLVHGSCASQIAMQTYCKEEAYNDVISLINALHDEPVSGDLEKAAEKHAKTKFYTRADDFIAGAEWQKEQDLAPTWEDMEEVAENYEQTRNDLDAISDNEIVRRAFKAGAEWMRKKDLALTWEDVQLLDLYAMECQVEESKGRKYNSSQEFFEEVLRRFNKLREE